MSFVARWSTKSAKKSTGLPVATVVGHAWLGFDHHPEIDEIIVVIREDARPQFQELAKKQPIDWAYMY